MRLLAIAASLLMLATAYADVYKLQHRRPSLVLSQISGNSNPGGRLQEIAGKSGLVPAGTKLTADDAAGTITIEGRSDSIENAKQVIAMFDVAPRQVDARIAIHSAADKFDS